MAVVTSLIISLFFGKVIINALRRAQVGETVRDLGLEGQLSKQGTPTMGGLIIIAATIIPTLLFAKLGQHLHHPAPGEHGLVGGHRLPRRLYKGLQEGQAWIGRQVQGGWPGGT
jgi:UDP-N-acetylmuramyl pentapeptide phosphotransferase/UDP-N-acetylglucosamine-1-phosphate transferase